MIKKTGKTSPTSPTSAASELLIADVGKKAAEFLTKKGIFSNSFDHQRGKVKTAHVADGSQNPPLCPSGQ
jgi:hypothetical protein